MPTNDSEAHAIHALNPIPSGSMADMRSKLRAILKVMDSLGVSVAGAHIQSAIDVLDQDGH